MYLNAGANGFEVAMNKLTSAVKELNSWFWKASEFERIDAKADIARIKELKKI